MTLNEQYRQLIEGVKLLALPYDAQINVLPTYVNVGEEVISTYREAFYLLPEIILKDLVTKECTALLIKLFVEVDLIANDEDLFTPQGLKESDQWQKIRFLANEILKALNTVDKNPNLGHITWIKL